MDKAVVDTLEEDALSRFYIAVDLARLLVLWFITFLELHQKVQR